MNKTIEQRARDYRDNRCKNWLGKADAERGYIAGATEEQRIQTQWINATEELPPVAERVLCKLANGLIAVGMLRRDGYFRIDAQAVLATPKAVQWRAIVD